MNKKNKVPFFASLQVKYALSYFVIFAVVLVLLNTYPLMASQELLFTSKRDSLKSQTAVMASALMELESLSAEQVARVMNMLDSMGTTRILVTDPAGLILYDSTRQPGEGEEDSSNGEAEYRYALYQEVVSALRGNDVFYSRYVDRMFTSTAAMPIVYRGMVIGAIYILEVDRAQGQLLDSLQ
ncbi:MAG: two-component sensor histidine kinase, partial [Lawsonibacter sp.]|nr:two-component sensor histidine kinase [Lawsonibacter sp.]